MVEVMKFQTAAWWAVAFSIDAPGQRDTMRFTAILM
jgi:hypothetical protein